MSDSYVIDIPEDPIDLGYSLYAKDKVTLTPGVTVLVGCNGCGKTTFIRIAEEQIKSGAEDTLVIKYNHLWDGAMAKDKAIMGNNMEKAAQLMLASEGECMKINLGDLVRDIGRQIRNNDKSRVWIFLDAMDSGFSIDNIVDMKDFFEFLQEQESGRIFYIVISANSYELARGERCLDVQSMDYIRFDDYEKYREFILKSRKKRDELAKGWYLWKPGTP